MPFISKKRLVKIENKVDEIALLMEEKQSSKLINVEQPIKIQEKKVSDYSEMEILRAAYALNLCTVSVSQIVDYSDLNILEQEYDAILNNINIENMPKDEALLKILEKILDTITFFRIQEGDKKFIDKDYQQKMKDAIWASVPNLSVIVASGNPFVALGALATQIGIGYMNYRKEKAKLTNEHEKELWQLERSAIEQFNALRRELFDTAWRLAKEYNFKDNFRLTEKQITQYNDILMDSNILRKYERLSTLKENFTAYPPYWYYLGDAACQLAVEARKENTEEKGIEIWNYYSAVAIECFENFRKCNNLNLLREDQIASSCCLQYVDLLDYEKDVKLIEELLEEAKSKSGNANDILQLCAMNYLKIKKYDKACELLRILVTEDYNATTNGQLLSQLYLNDAIEKNSMELLPKYENLKKFVSEEYLYPFPKHLPKTKEEKEILFADYLKAQKYLLSEKYCLVFNSLIQKYTIQLNKKIQNPDVTKEFRDEYFTDEDKKRNNRIKDLLLAFQGSNKNSYLSYLSNFVIGGEYLDTLNGLVGAFQFFDFLNKNQVSINSVEKKLIESKDDLEKMDSANRVSGENSFTISTLKLLVDYPLTVFIDEYIAQIAKHTKQYINQLISLSKILSAEANLREFCISEGLKEPDILFRDKDVVVDFAEKEILFTPEEFLSNDAQKINELKDLNEKQLSIIRNEEYKNISNNFKKMGYYIQSSQEYSDYIHNHKKSFPQNLKTMCDEGSILAILDDTSFSNKDFILTTSKIFVVVKSKLKKSFYYSETNVDLIDKLSYINTSLFCKLLKDLAKNEKREENVDILSEGFSVNNDTHQYLYSGIPASLAKSLVKELLGTETSCISDINVDSDIIAFSD